ncbi:MAG: ribulose-phosphate 3-epimerase [Desulfurellaceae bacterium]|nr:ribulose-phosphate 3-epimerase [Desulfurellaceae bacterium]
MRRKTLIAPSILAADITRLEEEVKALERAGVDLIHIDVMDGHFVPNITFGPIIVENLKKITYLPLDVHLMISNPEKYASVFVDAGADIVTVHQEASLHLHRMISEVKNAGAKAGVALNPATHPSLLEYVLNEVDVVLVMTVNPGFSGQSFIKDVSRKIEELDEMRRKDNYNFLIEVDGGVNGVNVKLLRECGADIFVSGNALFSSKDYRKTVKEWREKLK